MPEPRALLFWIPGQGANKLTSGKQAGPLLGTTAAEQFINFSSFFQSCLLMDIFQILHSLFVMHAVLHCLGYTANSKELQASKQDWVPMVCFSLHLFGPCTTCWPCSLQPFAPSAGLMTAELCWKQNLSSSETADSRSGKGEGNTPSLTSDSG